MDGNVDRERISQIWSNKGWGSGAMEEERGGGEMATMEGEQFSWGREVEEDEKRIQPVKTGEKEEIWRPGLSPA